MARRGIFAARRILVKEQNSDQLYYGEDQNDDLDSAVSEKIIPCGHGGYLSPEAIEELLRILLLHLGMKVEPTHKMVVSQ
jgi:hypothetical protein